MSQDPHADTREPRDDPRDEPRDEPTHNQREEEGAEGGVESYGGDPDAEPGVTEDELETGLERDQAEG